LFLGSGSFGIEKRGRMRRALFLVLVLAFPCAAGAEPKLKKELGEQVRAGIGKLTEEEVLKLVPGPVRVRRSGDGEADWILTWEEVTSVEVVLTDGKVLSATAEFNDTFVSKTLTLNGFKQIMAGTTRAEVEKTLGHSNSTSTSGGDMGDRRTKCRWSEGRRMFVYVKDGKVSSAGFLQGRLP
jgi:hypothetical protein